MRRAHLFAFFIAYLMSSSLEFIRYVDVKLMIKGQLGVLLIPTKPKKPLSYAKRAFAPALILIGLAGSSSTRFC